MNELIFTKLNQISKHNKYYTTYINLINKALIRNNCSKNKFEKHHIIPKSFKDIEDYIINSNLNIVNLTPREHFIAHLLLTKIFISKVHLRKMNWAFFQLKMCNKHQERYINSRLYSLIKKQSRSFVILYKGNKKIYIDSDDKDSLDKELNNGASLDMTEEYKVGRVGNMRNKKHSVETKLKMSISAKNSTVHGIGIKNFTTEELKQRGIKSANTRKQNELINPNKYTESRLMQSSKVKELYQSGILSNKGSNNPRYGVTLTNETKQLISVKRQRSCCNGYSHEELYNIFIKPLLDQQVPIKDICKQIPVKKTPFYLRKIISKYS